jgi:succinate dehydrogenase / fumarate reductase cytochrome b subunit
MAATGALLVVFVLGHMTGNLLAFRGAKAINDYSHLLQGSGVLLWILRIGLLLAAVLHVHSAWTLTRVAGAARPAGYAKHASRAATWSARLMRWGGVLLLVFIVFHIFHFTVGSVHPDFVRGDVYHNLVVAFRAPAVAGFYLLAMLALALHLHHGVWSAFQSLGAQHPRVDPGRRRLAVALAIVVPAGFAALPLAFYFGWLQ